MEMAEFSIAICGMWVKSTNHSGMCNILQTTQMSVYLANETLKRLFYSFLIKYSTPTPVLGSNYVQIDPSSQ